jgi:hypothetical protein
MQYPVSLSPYRTTYLAEWPALSRPPTEDEDDRYSEVSLLNTGCSIMTRSGVSHCNLSLALRSGDNLSIK